MTYSLKLQKVKGNQWVLLKLVCSFSLELKTANYLVPKKAW